MLTFVPYGQKVLWDKTFANRSILQISQQKVHVLTPIALIDCHTITSSGVHE